jgi:hypothetical protein
MIIILISAALSIMSTVSEIVNNLIFEQDNKLGL